MNQRKKADFKKLVFKVVKYDSDHEYYKARLAITLFDKTDVPYIIKAKSMYTRLFKDVPADEIEIENASIM